MVKLHRLVENQFHLLGMNESIDHLGTRPLLSLFLHLFLRFLLGQVVPYACLVIKQVLLSGSGLLLHLTQKHTLDSHPDIGLRHHIEVMDGN